jgi:uncharacterized FlgJ-related protein
MTLSYLVQGAPILSKKEYTSKFEDIALEQMDKYRIPASITLAQGILESNSGNSVLATKANNHFGIKCHADWNGEKIFMDDDAANECFRSYNKVEESYVDHSEFLKKGKRYQFLFQYELDDYKNWAYGLKQAGYATNPKYADQLIQIIEELELNKLDGDSKKLFSSYESVLNSGTKSHTHANDVNYVVATKGDTYYQIAQKNNITLRQLHKYNDFDNKKETLIPGDLVFIEPKRSHSKKKEFIILEKPMTLREVSQQEAVKLKSLMRKNQSSSPDEQLTKGEKVFLR